MASPPTPNAAVRRAEQGVLGVAVLAVTVAGALVYESAATLERVTPVGAPIQVFQTSGASTLTLRFTALSVGAVLGAGYLAWRLSRWAGTGWIGRSSGAALALATIGGVAWFSMASTISTRIEIGAEQMTITNQTLASALGPFAEAGRRVALDEIRAIEWTYHEPDGEAPARGRVTLVLLDRERVGLHSGGRPDGAWNLVEALQAATGAPLSCYRDSRSSDHHRAPCVT